MTLLKHRRIIAKVLGCTQTFTPLRGIPQGSVIACRLWIICMDELIEILERSGEITVSAYAYDLLITAAVEDENETQRKFGIALELIDITHQRTNVYQSNDGHFENDKL